MDATKALKEAEKLHQKKNDLDGAAEIYRKILETSPQSDAAVNAKSNLDIITAKQKYEEAYDKHYKTKDIAEAKKLYKFVTEKFPNSPEAGFASSQLSNIDKIKEREEAAKQLKSDQDIYLEELEKKGGKEINLTTAQSLEGYCVTKTIDIITAECVFGMNFLRDFFTGVRDFWGGRSGSSQKVLKDARKICLGELRKEARSVGADAVIAVSLAYSEFSGKDKSMLFLVASGTAVNIEKIE